MSEMLKPCPFCGSEAESNAGCATGLVWVCCTGCGVRTLGKPSSHEAITAWNTRAAGKPETLKPYEFYDCENTVDAGEDTREKLEADVRRFYEWHECDAFLSVDFLDVVDGWLDRQAAITERYWMEICGASANANLELKRQIDALETERDKLREKVRHQSRQLTDTQNALEKRNEEIKPRWKRDTKKLQSRIDALTAERDEWRARAAEEAANAEGHRRNANNIAEECDARARALDMQLDNIHNLEHERDELRRRIRDGETQFQHQVDDLQVERDELRRRVSELRELNDSLHARIESAREALS